MKKYTHRQPSFLINSLGHGGKRGKLLRYRVTDIRQHSPTRSELHRILLLILFSHFLNEKYQLVQKSI